MNIPITDKEFADICIAHGFAKHGKIFTRCIGDAIFQKISLYDSEYVDPWSPEYSADHRKAPRIQVGFYSMYANLMGDWFSDKRFGGHYYAAHCAGCREDLQKFTGTQKDYRMMMSDGFRIMDSITTQRKLLDTETAFRKLENRFSLYSVWLCAPHILCGEEQEALAILNSIYVQNFLTFHEKSDHLRQEGRYEEYVRQEIAFEQEKKEIIDYIYRVWRYNPRNQEEMNAYFLSNLERNILHAKSAKAAFSEDFLPLLQSKSAQI